MEIKIEIKLDELNDHSHTVKTVPVIHEQHDDTIAERGQVYFREMKKGEDRWYRMEGRSDDANPLNCKSIIVRASPGNPDVLNDDLIGYNETDGAFAYTDYPKNFYIQSSKLDKLYDLGYEDSRDNLPPRVD